MFNPYHALWMEVFRASLWLEKQAIRLRDYSQRKKMAALNLEHQSTSGW